MAKPKQAELRGRNARWQRALQAGRLLIVQPKRAEIATLLSVPRAAQRIGMTRQGLMKAICKGDLPVVMVGEQLLVRPADADNYQPTHKSGRPRAQHPTRLNA
jgi:hypothetical protein